MSIEDVRTLVAERQRFDDWLASLDAKRADTPVRVFERVYGDYSARRLAVVERLREHIGPLAVLGDELDARSQLLETELAAFEDERAEAMLRTAVGEYDADRWELVRLEVEASIAKLETQRDELRAEIDDVRTLLASARLGQAEEIAEEVAPVADEHLASTHDSAVESLSAVTAAEDAPAAEDAVVEAPVALDDTAPRAPTPVEASAAVAVETPAFFNAIPTATPTPASVASTDAGAPLDVDDTAWLVPPTAAVPAREATPVSIESIAAADDLDGTDFDDALALFSPSPRQPVDEPDVTQGRSVNILDQYPTTEDLTSRSSSGASSSAAADSASSTSARSSDEPSRDPFDDLAFLRSVIDPAAQSATGRATASGEQQKTLRCTECSTMNLPTEWYCERCGGELAAF